MAFTEEKLIERAKWRLAFMQEAMRDHSGSPNACMDLRLAELACAAVTDIGKKGWISCSERMPDSDEFVQIWPLPDFGVELHVGQYDKFNKKGAGWYAQVYEANYGIEWHPINVTHWMPLPNPPTE